MRLAIRFCAASPRPCTDSCGARETLAARYGGEEFILLLPQVDANAAQRIGEDIRASVESLRLHHPDSPVGPYVTISLGGDDCPHGWTGRPAILPASRRGTLQGQVCGRNRMVWQRIASQRLLGSLLFVSRRIRL